MSKAIAFSLTFFSEAHSVVVLDGAARDPKNGTDRFNYYSSTFLFGLFFCRIKAERPDCAALIGQSTSGQRVVKIEDIISKRFITWLIPHVVGRIEFLVPRKMIAFSFKMYSCLEERKAISQNFLFFRNEKR